MNRHGCMSVNENACAPMKVHVNQQGCIMSMRVHVNKQGLMSINENACASVKLQVSQQGCLSIIESACESTRVHVNRCN